MANSDPDSHDLDKLTRWRQGLADTVTPEFPVYAVFLVGPEDTFAHDVFREFRTSFESRNAPYEHLVIFGQHGLSKTLHGLRGKLSLSSEEIPLLALTSSPLAVTFYTLPLPLGSDGNEAGDLTDRGAWREILGHIEAASGSSERVLDLERIVGLNLRTIREGPLESVINKLLLRLYHRG